MATKVVNTDRIRVGDVVRLKSGSMSMVVFALRGPSARVIYNQFNLNSIITLNVPIVALVKHYG